LPIAPPEIDSMRYFPVSIHMAADLRRQEKSRC